MPHKHTYSLIEEYGDKFIEGSLEDEDIAALNEINSKLFLPSAADNMNRTDIMRDFVQTIAPFMSPYILHLTVERFLKEGFESRAGENTFMRNTTLDKNLLAFELVLHPESGAEHFQQPPISKDFTENGIKNLKEVILQPAVDYFQEKKNEILSEERKKLFNLQETKPSIIDDHDQDPFDFNGPDILNEGDHNLLDPTIDNLREVIAKIEESEVKNRATALCDELERLQEKTGMKDDILKEAISKTINFINNRDASDSQKEYNDYATKMKKHSWNVISAVGPLMLGLANAVASTLLKVVPGDRAKDFRAKFSENKKEYMEAVRRDKVGNLVQRLAEIKNEDKKNNEAEEDKNAQENESENKFGM